MRLCNLFTICVHSIILLAFTDLAYSSERLGASPDADLRPRALEDALEMNPSSLAFCFEKEGQGLGIIAYEPSGKEHRDNHHERLCMQTNRRARAIATIRHDYSCSALDTIALTGWFANQLGNPGLVSRRELVLVKTSDFIRISSLAVSAQPGTGAAQWSLFQTQLLSSSRTESMSTKTLDLLTPPETIAGILLWNSQSQELYAPTKSLTQGSDLLSPPATWPTFQSKAWEWLQLEETPWKNQNDLRKQIQSAEHMGDLADILIIASLRGELSTDSIVTVEQQPYWLDHRTLTAQEPTKQKKVIANFKRLQLQEAPCQISLKQQISKPGLSRGFIDIDDSIRSLRHLRTRTYRAVMDMAGQLEDEPATKLSLAAKIIPMVESYNLKYKSDDLKRLGLELPIPPESLLALQRNIRRTSQILKRNCLSGHLRLGLEESLVLPPHPSNGLAKGTDQEYQTQLRNRSEVCK